MPEISWDVNEYHRKTVGYLPAFFKYLKIPSRSCFFFEIHIT